MTEKPSSNGHAETDVPPGWSPDTITLSSGVTVRPKAAPMWAVQDLIRAMGRPPEPPMKMNEEKGREEPDEFDPAYLQAVEDHQIATITRSNDAMLLLGLDIVNVPAGVPNIKDSGWREDLRALGFDIATMHERLAYLKYFAVRSAEDMWAVLQAVGRLTGTREEDVNRAVESFRSPPLRGADRDAGRPEGDRDGDLVPSGAAGDGP